MKIHQCAQRSAQWHLLRLGLPTASNFSSIVTPKEGKLSKQAGAYAHKLLAEQMLGRVIEDKPYQSEWMERGERLEEEALKAYSMLKDVEVRQVGFVTVDSGRYGCSPDGLTDGGGVELKIPAPGTHMGYLLNPASLAEGYAPQVQGCMLICDRDVWDIVSYSPEMPPVIHRVKRNEEYVRNLRDALEAFADTLLAARVKLEALYKPFPAPELFEMGGRCCACGVAYEKKYVGTECERCRSLIVSQADVDAIAKEW